MHQNVSQLQRVETDVRNFVAEEFRVDHSCITCTVSSFFQTGLISYCAVVRVEVLFPEAVLVYRADVEDHRVTIAEEVASLRDN